MNALLPSIELHPGGREDELFYRSLPRPDEEEMLDLLPADLREGIEQMQFMARESYFKSRNARFYTIWLGEKKIGRVVLVREGLRWILSDFILLPSFRGQGLGTLALRIVLD